MVSQLSYLRRNILPNMKKTLLSILLLALILTPLLVSCGNEGAASNQVSPVEVDNNASSITKNTVDTNKPADIEITNKSVTDSSMKSSDGKQKVMTSNLNFIPTSDGFGFKNFVGGEGSSAVTVQDLIQFFGEDGLCSEGSGDSCIPYPGVIDFLGQLNNVLKNGLCYGFSAASTNIFSKAVSISSLDANATNTFALERTEIVERTIARLHMLQFTEEFRDEIDKYIVLSPLKIAEELKQKIDSLEERSIPPMTLALYTSNGGHSVTPISVEQINDEYLIHVYDSNWPGKSRHVSVKDNGEWTYQGGHQNPEEPSGAWSESGPGTMALIPHNLLDSTFKCFFCEESAKNMRGTGSVMILNATDSENIAITVTDDDGNRISRGGGANFIEIEGARSYVIPGDSAGNDAFLIYLPPETNDFEVSINSGSRDSKQFTLLHASTGHPTTTIKGTAVSEVTEQPTLEITVEKDGSVETVINPEIVEQVKQASSLSTTLFEPEDNEGYESNFKNGIIDDIKIVDNRTNEVTGSFKEMMEKSAFPLRPTENGDGTRFVKNQNANLVIELNDGTEIDMPTSDAAASIIQVTYSDGVKAAFGDDVSGNVVGSLSNGSSSVKFKDGGAIHSTKEGAWTRLAGDP